MAMLKQASEVEVLIRARYPVIYVTTWEEARVVADITTLARKRDKQVYEWSITTGLVPVGTSLQSDHHRDAATKDPLVALDRVISDVEPAIYIFKDFHHFLSRGNFTVVRRLREIVQSLKHSYKTVILIAPIMEIPLDLEKDVTVIDFDLPGPGEINALLGRVQKELGENPQVRIDLDNGAREKLVKAALGLTLTEAENVFAKILVTARRLDETQVPRVVGEKKQIIRKSGLLEYCETADNLSGVGGMDGLKSWLEKRVAAFSDDAQEFGLPAPRGILLLGVQGCGKSLTAKAIGRLWDLPLLRFDVGRVFGSLVGSSEENIRRAIKVAESVAPAILWIDEIDKAFARQSGTAVTDGGTASRVFGTFVTWLAEKQAPVFVVATANDIRALPPELIRKGRFDEVFFVDLPSGSERREIFRIHIEKRKRDPAAFDLDELAGFSEGFSGAEIEESIVSALFDAFYDKKDLSTKAILKCIRETVPLSKTMEEEIARLRRWADGRARNAAVPRPQDVADVRRKIEL
ncbi:MAG: AAA family ATPase [Candidatus Brocadiaceae bacterium]|nr:AAA family ATPase [Candidatus Brocadiaceae bacterium]